MALRGGMRDSFLAPAWLSVEKRVQTGRHFGDRVEIVEGLRPEELVVVEPGNLVGGQPVTISP